MKAKVQSAAVITVKDASKMTKRGRKAIATWMRRQATLIERHADDLASRFTARYLY